MPKRNRQRNRQKRPARRKAAQERPPRGIEITVGSGLPAMSQTLLDFAEPLLFSYPHPPSAEEMTTTLQIAQIGWNMAVLEEMGGRRARRKMRQQIASRGLDDEELAFFLDRLVERKRRHFGNDPRYIAGFTVTERGSRRLVTAAGIIPGV